MTTHPRATTGLQSLDEILDGLRLGDNVVWVVDDVADYRAFVAAFVRAALADRRPLVYLRFASHPPLLDPSEGITVYDLDAFRGFESFAARIHQIITQHGRETFYVFDCLSDLLDAWATDLMIGNFFRVTCPYLFELDTVAYFALLDASHSNATINRIRETTQLFLRLQTLGDQLYVHPLKVWQRYSPTMFLPHVRRDGVFTPVANSFDATTLLTSTRGARLDAARRQLDYWDRLFLEAQDLARSGDEPARRDMLHTLCRVFITAQPRMLELAQRHLTLEDLLEIRGRTIGTGYIGGKAAGMLIARRILLSDPSFDWASRLEPHDSFYLGSDVYYWYIVHNGWWRLFMQQKTPDGYFSAAAELSERMRHGRLPDDIRDQLHQMLEYFGQYPIIVRSSSVLEDNYGNAFAGKYDSVFLANQGSPQQRYDKLEAAIRDVFASAMSEDALVYRKQRGLDRQQEQMALLFQRVSGSYRRHFYFPDVAGVGASRNTFAWHRQLDPHAGMLRLVLGLGTRAVDRVEGDYARIVALDAPLMTPQADFDDVREHSQRAVDVLNLSDNQLQSVPLIDLVNLGLDLPMQRLGVRDADTARALEARGRPQQQAWVLTFEPLLRDAAFVDLFRRLLKTLETAYAYPVDVEFTVNFAADGRLVLNLLQCRPLQVKGPQARVRIPDQLDPAQLFFRSTGRFMGGSVALPLQRIIRVDPAGYADLSLSDKYELARIIGRLNKTTHRDTCPTLLMGPGRWGTSTPSLGIPVRFAEINNMVALAEVAFTSGGMVPDLSFGTHFFQDLVETDIFYLALFPGTTDCEVHERWLDASPNILPQLLADLPPRFRPVIGVYDLSCRNVQLLADLVTQQLLCLSTASP